MVKQRVLTTEAFERLLAWLDADRGRAGEKYRHIHRTLIQIFVWNGCMDAEAWADEVVDRVVEKLPELAAGYKGDPAPYFYGVAKRAVNECRREQSARELLPATLASPAPDVGDEEEEKTPSPLDECTAECMASLKRTERKLLLRYFRWRGQKKIDAHRDLAEELGLRPGALRVKVHRARARLDECILDCMRRKGADETIWWKKT
jgi:DNA-directed RNA polymerase specialized sigma24 family protein